MSRVSVLMGIYNCAPTLEAALASLEHQTYTDWELVVCDDGSQDDSFAIAKAFAQRLPDQVVLLKNDQNLGLNRTLNRCLEQARGEYIARQDGDDISFPHRFEQQVAYLDAHPEMALVSAPMVLFDHQGDWGVTRPKANPEKEDLIDTGAFAHAACMMRREALQAVGGYSVGQHLLRVEDFHLWYKLYQAGYRGANLSAPLYRAQDDRAAQGRRSWQNRVNEARVRWLIFKDFGLSLQHLPRVLRPLLVGLLPGPLYRKLHQGRLGAREEANR